MLTGGTIIADFGVVNESIYKTLKYLVCYENALFQSPWAKFIPKVSMRSVLRSKY